jgi:hypothetical protein
MITKRFRTYAVNSLRQEKGLRDHGVRTGGDLPI